MLKTMKKRVKSAMMVTFAAAMTFSFTIDASAAKQLDTNSSTYRTVTEIEDWGAAITKVIVNLNTPIPQNSVTKDTFNVHVKRSDDRLANPFLEEGYRTVTNAFVSDEKGNPAVRGKYVVLEMEIGPTVTLGSALNYYRFNDWVDSEYTISQVKDIVYNSGKISGLVVTSSDGGTRGLVDDFSSGSFTHEDTTLTYANYEPQKTKGKEKNPLVIWLHGGGEGGTDTTIPLSANKATAFASEEIQAYFDGAHVLAPQTPTRWMQGVTGSADGTSIYQEALMALIEDYVANHKDVDPNRIYIGGASNGGYMTMLMARDYPGYFAAAYPVCEGLNNSLITDEDIQALKQTPIWFVHAKNDTTLRPEQNTIPTYNRLLEAGATNVHLSLFEDVHDTSGLYKNADGTPYQYPGHWSWIYVYNNEPTTMIDGKKTTIMEWMAAQSK
ncbi:prolyl oligopeptidase family serine peptidase [Bacillus coreaensis]